jgi:molybdopterin molybdotransferase
VISVQEALRILRDNIPEPRKIIVPLEEAYCCFLFEEIRAPESSPRYTNSAMDGFAVRWTDCKGAGKDSPATLQIIGESQAGIPFDGEVTAGTAARISTGAMLPAGADSVVRVEDTSEKKSQVEVREIRSIGQDVRSAGEEFKEGEKLFSKGYRLGSRELALLASFGIYQVPVYAPPKVSLLVTGTELASPADQAIQPHQIRDSNSIMLANAVREVGASVHARMQVEDSLAHTIQAVQQAADSGDDIILCSGGVSVGKHDHVKDAALAAGFTELFWKIRQKPGKPLFVCKRDNTLLFGLPGNPVSAFMCFHNYVRPVIAELLGTSSVNRTITAKTTEMVVNNGKRTNFIRVCIENKPNEVTLINEIAQQGSHMLSSIVNADGYIVLEPGEKLRPGSLVEVYLF